MPVVSNARTYGKLRDEEIAWKLLRAQNAPYIIAILDEHLGGEVNRRTVSEMNELVDFDLQELNERILGMPLELTAKEYLEKWRRDGYLVRKPNADTRQETYELSGGALAAIGFVKGMAQPRRTATKSRLGIIFDQITSLSVDVGTDDERRRAALLAQRETVDEKLRELDEGRYEPLDEKQALEKTEEIIGLAKEIPQDFAFVSDEFERISKALYAKLIGYDEDYADLLGDVFAGVDHIGQSPAGQSFRGFYDLLQDVEESERLYDSIDVILAADFSQKLSQEQRTFLRRLVQTLLQQSRGVNDTMTGLARGLRRFVQSQSFQEDRLLKRLLDRSLSLASELTDAYPSSIQLPLELQLTSTRIEPLSRQKLRDPSDDELPQEVEVIAQEDAATISLEELRAQIREVEIDFGELVENVNACLGEALSREAGSVSVAEVLRAFPATQGVASVIGLMMLADEQGVHGDGAESVSWSTAAGEERCATIERYEFIQEVQ